VERIGGEESNGSESGGLDSLMCRAKWGAERNGQIGKEDCRQRANERAMVEVALRHKAEFLDYRAILRPCFRVCVSLM
jgi:hypothetical protein